MDKEGFRIYNIQTGRFSPWNRYAETATGIIKTSHEIWLRRTQRVFHIGGWKKKALKESVILPEDGKESLVLKAPDGKQIHYSKCI